jgi:hypothetical protein
VAWEFREAAAHTVDFKIEFVEPGMKIGEEQTVLPTERLRVRSSLPVMVSRVALHL